MKRLLLVLILGITIPLLSVAPSYSSEAEVPWQIYHLSTTPPCNHNNNGPQINNSGWVTWEGEVSGDGEILLFKGTGPIQPITISDNSSSNNSSPQINKNGWVTWQGFDSSLHRQIYLWKSSGSPTMISTTSSNNSSPQINDSGWVTWQGGPDVSSQQIYLWKSSGSPTMISTTSSNNSSPQINNNGWVTWQGYDGSYMAIYLWTPLNPTTPIKINNSSSSYTGYPQINNSTTGWVGVTWQKYDGSDMEIYLCMCLTSNPNVNFTIPISTNSSSQNYSPQINDNLWVTWSGSDSSPHRQIYLWNLSRYGLDPLNISNNSDDNEGPQINNSGSVTWVGWHMGTNNFKIYLYQTGSTTTIRSVDNFVCGLQINSSGRVTWSEGWGLSPIHPTTPTEIYLYSPILPIILDPGNITLDIGSIII
jgi:hypothetical protein